MAFLIGGANSASGAYEIENSLRFNDDDSPSLSRANDSGGSNTAGTLSFWTKRSEIDTGYLFYARSDDSNVFNVYFSGNERLEIRSTQGGSAQMSYKTNALFRDPSAWYHIVIAIDTTDGTAADRCKLFVNGSRITSFETQTNFGSSNTIELFQSDATVYVAGEFEGGTIGNPYDGYIADLNFVDGTQYDASYFGETNDNGVWIPKKFSGTQGTNGFFMEFQQTGTSANASGMGADTSGNDNHLTPTNLTAEDVTTATPTNNFCTLNPLNPTESNASFSEGNLRFTNALNSSPHHALANGTMAVANGKWYWEVKVDDVGGTAMSIGAIEVTEFAKNDFTGDNGVGYFNNGNFHYRGTEDSDPNTYTTNDIIGVALDMDNKAIYFHKNGTYEISGDPTSGASRTGAAGGTLHASNVTMVPAVSNYDSVACNVNFGNAAFSISSGNADANGYGNFEYAVPSGYYALCTKNLAEYG